MSKIDHTEEIKRRLNLGQTPAEIAEAVGVSARRVYQIRGETPREPLTAAKREAIRQAVALGKSKREAAKEFGVSRTTVDGACEGLDAAPLPPRGRVSEENVAHILSRASSGRSAGTIARETGLDANSVRAVIRRHASSQELDPIMRAIADQMVSRGMTAHGLAELVASPPTRETLYAYLRGDMVPSTAAAAKIISALGGDAGRIFSGN